MTSNQIRESAWNAYLATKQAANDRRAAATKAARYLRLDLKIKARAAADDTYFDACKAAREAYDSITA